MAKTSTHPLLVALREAAAAAARAAKIEARLYEPGSPGLAELTEAEGVEAHAIVDAIVRSLLEIEGVADRVTLGAIDA